MKSMECLLPQVDDLSRSLLALKQDRTLVAVLEMSQSLWLLAGMVTGVDRQPLKKFEPDATALLRLLKRWRDEATRGGPDNRTDCPRL
jgi:transposase